MWVLRGKGEILSYPGRILYHEETFAREQKEALYHMWEERSVGGCKMQIQGGLVDNQVGGDVLQQN